MKKKSVFYPLDNAAKIYPPTASEKRPHVFSFTAVLYYDVEPDVLRIATERVLKNNPTFNTKLMSGKFWYYLEENNAPFIVHPEEPYYLKSIDYKQNNNYLFKVLYHKNRITFNFFHALTDGTGGFNFFSQVLLEYFELMQYDIDSEGLIRTSSSPFYFEDGFDNFLLHDKNIANAEKNPKKPIKIVGTPFDYDGIGMITAKVDVATLKTLAKEYNATITAFLSGVYVYNIYLLLVKNKPTKNKKITLLVPCNLRKKYGGNTVRNFSMFARVSHEFVNSDYTLREIVDICQKQIVEQLTTENLDKIIHSNVKAEKNLLIKIVPLSIKNIIMRLAYKNVGEDLQTASFSNLGLVNLPNSFGNVIKHLTFSIAPTFTCQQQFTAIGFNDSLYLTFTRDFVENTLERNFFRMLSEMGVELKVFSNYWESEI